MDIVKVLTVYYNINIVIAKNINIIIYQTLSNFKAIICLLIKLFLVKLFLDLTFFKKFNLLNMK